MNTAELQYDVCLSFAGEQRAYVEQVAGHLSQQGVSVFYDAYEEATLWGRELYEHLDNVYRRQAQYCVIFISGDYAEKVWTNHERRSAQARALRENREYILPARFDDTEIPGIPPTIGYVDLRRIGPDQLATIIVAKLARTGRAARQPDRAGPELLLAHAAEDADLVRVLHDRLVAEGHLVRAVTLDSLPGQDGIGAIVGSCRFFSIYLTSRSVESAWLRTGLSAAMVLEIERHARILPLLHEDCAVPAVLYEREFIDFRRSQSSGQRDLEAALAGRAQGSRPLLRDPVGKLRAAVNGSDPLCLAVDLGGTKTYVSLMDGQGNRFYDKKFLTEGHGDAEELLSFLLSSIRQVMSRVSEDCGIDAGQLGARLRAVGLAFPGPTDFETGVVLGATNLRIGVFPLAERITQALGVQTFVDNDVNLGVLGESWKGVAQGYRNAVGIIIGTGIGGGVIIDGQIYRGATKAAGEIGHIVLDIDSEHVCPCGQRGCFEALASRKSIARDLIARKLRTSGDDVRWQDRNLGSNEAVLYYELGDADAVEVFTNAARACGKAVFSVLNVLNPEIVFFSGGFVTQLADRQLADSFLSAVIDEAGKCMEFVYGAGDQTVPIKIGKLDNAMLLGACKMALHDGKGTADYDVADVVRAAAGELDGTHLQILRSLERSELPIPISQSPGSDFHEDRLRVLRNRGLVATDTGASFRRSRSVHLTDLGRIVLRFLSTSG